MAKSTTLALSNLQNAPTGEPIDIEAGDELFEMTDPGLITSKGRKPLEASNVIFEDAKVDYNGEPAFDNSLVKFPGKNVVGLFGEYKNLFDEPLSTLATTNATLTQSSETINDSHFVEVDSTLDGGYAEFAFGTFPADSAIIRVTIKRGTANNAYFRLRNISIAAWGVQITVDWNLTSVSFLAAYSPDELVSEKWFGDDVVELAIKTYINVVHNYQLRLYGNVGGTGTTLFSELSLTSGSNVYPYNPGNHSASSLTYSYDWPDQGTIEFWLKPQFSINDHEWVVALDTRSSTSTSGFVIAFPQDGDYVQVRVLKDGSNYKGYTHTFTDFNNWYHFKLTYDLSLNGFSAWINGVSLSTTFDAGDISNLELEPVIRFKDSTTSFRPQSYISDFIIKPYIDETTTHYTNGLPYFNPLKLYGKSGTWSIDDKGSAYFRELITRYGPAGGGVKKVGKNNNGAYILFHNGFLICMKSQFRFGTPTVKRWNFPYPFFSKYAFTVPTFSVAGLTSGVGEGGGVGGWYTWSGVDSGYYGANSRDAEWVQTSYIHLTGTSGTTDKVADVIAVGFANMEVDE